MALSTYAELQSAIVSHLLRPELAGAQVQEFIRLAEAGINRDVRLVGMETVATGALVAGTPTLTLPADYLEGRTFSLAATPVVQLEIVSPSVFFSRQGVNAAGVPRFFTVLGLEAHLGPVPDAAYAYTLHYARRQDLAATSTSWLLTNHPDLYFYGALVQAAPFLRLSDERVEQWSAFYSRAVEAARLASERLRYSGGPLRMMRA